jgi:oligoribonuclease (3'-5' exoribonuclease)
MLSVDAHQATLWTADQAVLAGIQTGYIPNSHVLCGNRIEAWTTLMVRDHPELASYFQSRTASLP